MDSRFETIEEETNLRLPEFVTYINSSAINPIDFQIRTTDLLVRFIDNLMCEGQWDDVRFILYNLNFWNLPTQAMTALLCVTSLTGDEEDAPYLHDIIWKRCKLVFDARMKDDPARIQRLSQRLENTRKL